MSHFFPIKNCTHLYPFPFFIQIVPNLSPVLNQNYAQLYPFLWNQNCAQINPFFADIVSNLFQFFFYQNGPKLCHIYKNYV